IQMRYPREARSISYLRALEKSQWWSSSELETFQQKKLHSLIKYAYNNVPYYHRMLNQLGIKPRDIKNISDLQQLPLLTKEIIRNNLDDLTSKSYSKDKLISSATGGSTGEPLSFFIDKRWIACNEGAAYREWSWAEYNLGDKIAYLWGAPQDMMHQKELKTKIFNLTHRMIKLNAFNMTEKNMGDYIKILRKHKPKVINSYASAIYLLAKYVEKEGIEDINPTAILTTAEMLFHHERKTIERVFGCEVFHYYSGRDTTLQAGECAEHSGYHLSIENAVIEFIKDGESVAPGETGKIIITDLCNYAMPFIRYEIGDLGEPSDEICPCGRGLPLMKSIKGRILDTIITPDGKYLTGVFFPTIFVYNDIKGIKEFQIIQKRKDKLLIKLVKGNDYSEEDLNLFENMLRKYLGNEMNIDVKFVDVIEPTISGKRRPIISEVKLNM
ncbi:MAG: hypothetical protein K8R68_06920, partial [Bacteroidales bacterium]|nr:hypothetical protein [Bacteroidales bacterium]